MATGAQRETGARRMRLGLGGMIIAAVGVIALLALIIFVIDWAQDQRADDPLRLSPAEVASRPEQFYGEEVALTGTVDQQLGARAFGFEGVLVITQEDLRESLQPGQTLSLSGRVTPYDAATLRDEGMANPDSSELDGWRDQPMLIADAVEYQ